MECRGSRPEKPGPVTDNKAMKDKSWSPVSTFVVHLGWGAVVSSHMASLLWIMSFTESQHIWHSGISSLLASTNQDRKRAS